jgi:glucose-1-phosphate cytidylyltransferase
MKVVILAGGMGTRLTEETQIKPKPMVEVGGRPILWHIMKSYAHYGLKEFVVALGYKGEFIKRYFLEYRALSGSLSLDLGSGRVTSYAEKTDDWTVHLMDTGLNVMTGGRVRRLQPLLGDETFMLTYGDGVSDVDLNELLRFHRSHGRIATITAVRPPARFGGLRFDGDLVVEFTEKPQIGEGWINGGFMVLEPQVFRYLKADSSVFETDALERLASDGQLAAYRHERFWQCMDTMRDLRVLEGLWEGGAPPWRVWD